jgi:2-polyprenyl-3-methyl-5-hydroxy-6-metoxy-1,4-benzoquinol methylase
MTGKKVYCPLCEEEIMVDYVSPYRGRDQLFSNRVLYQCQECRLIFLHPIPNPEELNHYYKTVWTTSEETSIVYQIQAEERVRYLKNHITIPPNAKILDIGTGHGLLYEALSQNGFPDLVFYATDPNPENLARLRKKGIRAFSDIREIKDRDFDLIFVCSVLEHIGEPVQFLLSVKEYFKNGGYMFLDLPERDDTFKQILEPHVTVYTIESLKNLVKKTQFSIIHCTGHGMKRSTVLLNQKQSILVKFLKSFNDRIQDWIYSRLFPSSFLTMKRNRLYREFKFNEEGIDRWWIRAILKK